MTTLENDNLRALRRTRILRATLWSFALSVFAGLVTNAIWLMFF